MMDSLNYKREPDLINGIKKLLAHGVTQFQVAFHPPSGYWAISFPPQTEPIYDEHSESV